MPEVSDEVFEQLTPYDLASLVDLPLNELRGLSADSHTRYTTRYELKKSADGTPNRKNGKKEYRRIDAPDEHLKAAQRGILSVLEAVKLLPCVFGVKGAGSVDNASQHVGRRYHFLVDVKRFFPSVKAPAILRALRRVGLPRDTSQLIRDLVTYGGHLPQGAPTSSMIANLVFREADEAFLALAQDEGLVYTRYVDDLTFSGSHDFQSLGPTITNLISEHGFSRNHDKTLYFVGAVQVTGAMAGQNRLFLPSDMVEKFDDPNFAKEQIAGLVAYADQLLRAH